MYSINFQRIMNDSSNVRPTSLMDTNASCFCYEKPDFAGVLDLVPPTMRAETTELCRSAPPLRCLGATTVADRECL